MCHMGTDLRYNGDGSVPNTLRVFASLAMQVLVLLCRTHPSLRYGATISNEIVT